MDSYEWNKIAGWVLAAMVAVLGLSIGTGYFYPKHLPETPAYIVEGVEEGGNAGAAKTETPFEAYLASADASKGEAQFKKCAACHTIDKGGANAIGPNLYGIVGSKHAHLSGFAYSSAMMETAGKTWDWDSLSQWVENPRKYIPGNKMSFAGIGKPQDRANLLVYLNSKSDSPLPLPAVPEAEPEAADAGDAAAEGEAADENAADTAEEAAPAEEVAEAEAA